MIKEKRRRRRTFWKVIRAILIIIVILAILGLVAYKVFAIEDVKIKGNKLHDQKLIESVILNDEYSINTLYVFLKYKIFDTEELPFIDTMEVSLDVLDPHTLYINVYEKGTLGYLYISGIGENAYFDKDGFVVETSTDIIEGIPKVEGLNCESVVLYEKLPVKSTELRELLSLTQTLKRKNLVPETIRFGSTYAPELKYKDLTVYMGDSSLLTMKVDRLEAIMPSVKNKVGTLHLEKWSEENTNIVFDEKK